MSDVVTVIRKEVAELFGNRRFLWVFVVAVAATGGVPSLLLAHHSEQGVAALGTLFLALYVLLATVIVVANTSPDMVLHERVGHTLDYLLTTRLPVRAIFAAKVLVSSAVGYCGALLVMAIQLAVAALFSGAGFQWLYLGTPGGRLVAFGITAGLALYVAVVGTFVALRVGEQRAAYMVTIFSVGVLVVPFLLGWLPVELTTAALTKATIGLGIFALLLGRIGLVAFRREMLVLYLQE